MAQGAIVPLTDEELVAVADDPAMVAKFTSDERRRMTKLVPQSRTWGDTLTDNAIGVGKGMANTAIGLGEMVAPALRMVPGVRDIVATPDEFTAARAAFATPTNTPQSVGMGAEQVAEFFTPMGVAGKFGKAAEVVKAGGLTLAQGGSPTAAGVSAGITAAIPGASAAKRGAAALQTSAEKTMAQSLGATKEWAKSDAARLAPEMLRRGVRGSHDAMLGQADEQVAAAGAKIGAAIQDAAAKGVTVRGDVVRGELQLAADALMEKGADGVRRVVPGTEVATRQLQRLERFVESLGDDIPVDQAQRLKQTWDRIVSKSGLYGQKATSSATDNATAWATREASGSFRTLLAQSTPDLAKLNQEFRFWKGLQDVLTATKLRTQAQGGGLVAGITGAAGAASGFASGGDMSDKVQNALIGGASGKYLVKALQSPAWRTTVTGPMKHALADALASGNAERISQAVGRIVAALPGRSRGPATPPEPAIP